MERLVFTDTVNQWRIYDTYLSYDQTKAVVDMEDSEAAEEQELAGVRWELGVIEVEVVVMMMVVVEVVVVFERNLSRLYQ